MNVEEIKTNMVARVKCQRSLLFHTRYFFKKNHNRKFVLGEHHYQITDLLEDVIAGKIKRVIINIAPRYSKTEIAVKNFISHCLSINPACMFIHLSYSDDLALDNSEEIKDIVTSDAYQALFPEVQIKKDSKSKKKWYTTAGGGVYATSAGGQITGFGAGKVDDDEKEIIEFFDTIEQKEQFGGAIIIDDPIKPDDTDSDIRRERINNRYDSTIQSRVNSRDTPIIIIMQRLHPLDLCGYLISKEPETWTVLSLPAIKPDGSALWPFKQTIEELNALRLRNEIVFDRQYMQNPKPLKGLVLPEQELKRYKDFPPSDRDEKGNLIQNWFVAIGMDTADEGTDYFSMPVARVYGNRVYIFDAIFDQENLTIQEGQVVSKVKECRINCGVVETNKDGAYFRRRLSDLVPEVDIYGQFSHSNKMARILANVGLIKLHFYFPLKPNTTLQNLMNQACRLTKTSKKEDDAADSLAMLAAYLEKYHGLFKNDE